MNVNRHYHINRASFYTSVVLEISRQNDHQREAEISEYKEFIREELRNIADNLTPVPCPF